MVKLATITNIGSRDTRRPVGKIPANCLRIALPALGLCFSLSASVIALGAEPKERPLKPEVAEEKALDTAAKEAVQGTFAFPPSPQFEAKSPRWVYSPLPEIPTEAALPGRPVYFPFEAAPDREQSDAIPAQENLPEQLLPEDDSPNSSTFVDREDHRENDFLEDSDAFNDQVQELNRLLNERWQEYDKNFQNQFKDQENLGQEMQREWRQKRVEAPFYRLPEAVTPTNAYHDDRYLSERSRLEILRLEDWSQYRAERVDVEQKMLNYDRTSDEYLRLQKNLNELDQRQAARERDYDRENRDLAADYSLSRW